MAFITEFKSPEGEKLPIAASTLVTVEVPAAGSADKGNWMQAAESTPAPYNQQAGHNAPKHSAVIPHCTDPSVFTDHGLRIDYEEQLQGWVLWIDSLPAEACTLTLLFINHSTEGTPCVLPALGGDTLEQAKAYTDEQRLGYTEPAKVLTFDISNYTEEDYVMGVWAKISDEPVDLSKVAEVMVDAGEELVFSDLTVGVLPDGVPLQIPHSCLFGELEGEPVPLVLTLDTTDLSLVGTYVIADAFRGYIKFAEVVHKIDEKYLPSGGGLPVVELTTNFLVSLENGEPVTLSAEECAQIDAAVALSDYLLLKMAFTIIPTVLNASVDGKVAAAAYFPGTFPLTQDPVYVFLEKRDVDWVGYVEAVPFFEG